MDKKAIAETLDYLKAHSPARKFVQNVDLIITLKNLNIKKDTDKVLIFTVLPHGRGKKVKIGAFVGQELLTSAKATCDAVILGTDFANYNKKAMKKLAQSVDFFVAQATLMPQVAATFGKLLGPRGKMPNPKAGCIVPPTADLKPVVQRLQKTVKLETKNEMILRAVVGNQQSKDEEVAENVLHVYNTVLHALPQEKNNIAQVLVKYTMGPAVEVGNLPKEQDAKAAVQAARGAKHGA